MTTQSDFGTETSSAHRLFCWAMGLVILLALGFLFSDALGAMVGKWLSPEYSHGYLIPLISLFLIYQKRREVFREPPSHTWLGLPIILFGLFGYFVGELGTVYTVIQYAFLISIAGVVVLYIGTNGFQKIWVPIAYLIFMIPLPQFLYQGISTKMQLISSEIGVAVIRLFGISVFLEGNIIDLGNYQLEVAEACNGLRYLFPLMSFGFLCAYIYRAPFWQRVIVFLSTIPIAILMNSLRIGMVGIMVDYSGIEAAEGFMHYFEGWVVFILCLVLLFLEMMILARLSGAGFRLNLVSDDRPATRKADRGFVSALPFGWMHAAALAAIAVVAVATAGIETRAEEIPPRRQLSTFPLVLGDWRGQESGLEQVFLDALRLSDYVIANYQRPADDGPVNVYVAYYDSQRKGQSAHSPASCIPGGGWSIESLRTTTVDDASASGGPLRVNRVIIGRGDFQQLVYYWFDQRGRHLTNEYAVKWYIFWDSLTRNRSDGALVRLTTPVTAGRVDEADARLQNVVRHLYPRLDTYIPS